MSLSDEQIKHIIDGCRKNNRQSQRDLYEWLQGYAHSVCKRYANEVNLVEDLVMDGFMKIFKKIAQYDMSNYAVSEAAFKGWSKRVFINNCINYSKKYFSATLSLEEITEQQQYEPAINEEIIQTLGYQEIIQLVMSLPMSYKTIFCLHIIDGYTHQEIANLLGINEGTSKSNLFKAKRHLQLLLSSKSKLNG
ncbi:sigma-70 family RNA polymerase sigma factor [Sediminibacterium sp.]|uniref:RNA polymerase sigma factor n=1 Tax=Sediminibacterium sp. TaxID=1917865 RepID=UPI0025DC501E|nr:sigma-70 family RNA polymerase sigma factor [Sediminibacterium sp.]